MSSHVTRRFRARGTMMFAIIDLVHRWAARARAVRRRSCADVPGARRGEVRRSPEGDTASDRTRVSRDD